MGFDEFIGDVCVINNCEVEGPLEVAAAAEEAW